MNIHTFDLDISKEPVSLNHLTIGQGDLNGTTVKANIFDDGAAFTLTSYSVYFNMLLPDGKTMYRKAGTKSGNVATFVIDESRAGAVVGVTNDAYVTIEQAGSVIASTEKISVRVLRSAKNAQPAESWSSDVDEAQTAIAAATAAAEQSASDIAAQMQAQQAAYESAEATRNANSTAATTSANTAATNANSKAELADTAAARANKAAGLAEEAAEGLGDQASYYTYETVGDDELLTLVTID